jgi:hypothetical protein
LINRRQSRPKALQWISLSILTSAIFAGCVHTDLPAQVVARAPVGTAKLPLKVAVMDDPLLTVHEPFGFYERLNPSLTNTIRDALAVHFETVVVVDETQSVAGQDLFATLSYSGRPLKLTVTFVEPKIGGKRLAEISSSTPFDADAPGTHDHWGTDLALIAPALVFPPLYFIGDRTIQRHDAERFNAGLGPALVAMATDIAAQASKDPAIASLATQQQPMDHQSAP